MLSSRKSALSCGGREQVAGVAMYGGVALDGREAKEDVWVVGLRYCW